VTTETEYVPVAEAPTMDQLRADMKKAATEHPDYGTCPHCIKAVRVDKFGRLRDHTTPELAMGSMKASYHCPGGGKPYAEHGDFGQTWDLKVGRWVDLDVDVPVLFVAHDVAAEKGVELPIWQLWGTKPDDVARRAVSTLFEGSKWRIELAFAGATVAGHLVRLDRGDRGPTLWETQVDEAAYGGTERVIGKLLRQLDAADHSDRAAAAK